MTEESYRGIGLAELLRLCRHASQESDGSSRLLVGLVALTSPALRFRPRPGLSRRSASVPPSVNRFRHRSTVCRLTLSNCATDRAEWPSPRSNTIRLRRTTRCGILGERAHRSSSERVALRFSLSSMPLAQSISGGVLVASQSHSESQVRRTSIGGLTSPKQYPY